ncbi:zinc-ribbon domain-containing protein, partial [Lactococcus formosensis]
MKTIKCQNCGSKNKQNAKFCINCGSAIETILEEQGVDASKTPL